MLLPSWSSRTYALLLGLGFAATPAVLHAQAQATTGVIRGTVSDTTGKPLPGATVSLRNVETNAVRVLTTNERGAFVGTLLRVGTYDVGARALGFQEAKRDSVGLRLGETVDLQLALIPQAFQLEELTVSGEPTDRRLRLGVGYPAQRGSGGGAPQQRAKHLQLHYPDPQRGDRAGAGRGRDQHRRAAGDPQQRLGGRSRLQQPVLRRAARRPAAGLHLQPRRGAGLRGGRPTGPTRSSGARAAASSTSSPSRAPTSSTARRTTSGSTTPSPPTSATPSQAGAAPDSLPTSTSISSAPPSAGRSCGTRHSSSWPTTSRSTTRPSRPTGSG